MKILYITSVFDVKGGSEIYCRDIISELLKRGHEVALVTSSLHRIEGVPTLQLPRVGHNALYKFEAPFALPKVLKFAREFKPDIIQSHSNCFMGLLGHFVKKELKVPHILLIELISSINPNLHSKAIHSSEKILLPKLNYDYLVTWTENIKNRFLIPWGIPEEKITISSAAINTDSYDMNLEGTEIREKYGKNLIISMKTLWKQNVLGLEYIVKAMKYVSAKYPEWKYIIFGDGKEKQRLIELVKQLHLEKNVLFGGHVYSPDAKKVLAATDISPHSFVYEFSTSISLLENMAMGKPCVVTDIGAVKEFVRDTGLIVKPYDEKAIAESIITLIKNPVLRKKLGKKARELVEKEYSIKKTVDHLENLYWNLV